MHTELARILDLIVADTVSHRLRPIVRYLEPICFALSNIKYSGQSEWTALGTTTMLNAQTHPNLMHLAACCSHSGPPARFHDDLSS